MKKVIIIGAGPAGLTAAYELLNDNNEEYEVIIDTGGIPFSPKIDNSVKTVIDMVYTKAESWYGSPLPYNIEERIAKELYGDSVFESIKYLLKESNISEEQFEEESFKNYMIQFIKAMMK